MDLRPLRIPAGPATLDADLALPAGATGIVLFAHGSGSSRLSPRNRHVARRLNDAGLGTVLRQQLGCLAYGAGVDVAELLHDRTSRIAASTRSGVIGSSRTRAPTALKMALAMVAGTAVLGGSPTTLAP